MRAVFAKTFGGDDPVGNLRIGDVADPVPAPGEVRVRVTAATLNHHDLWTLKGVGSRSFPGSQVLGMDAAGVVDSYGDGARAGTVPVGDRVVLYPVFGCGACDACLAGDQLLCPRIGLLSEPPRGGTLAEYVVVPVQSLVALPDSIDDVVAACLPTAYLTAYRMLFQCAGLRPGQSVLVQGASGGVATAAILLARVHGITVFATSRTEAKRSAALELGATAAFDPADRAAVKQLIAATGGGVDAVVETVGDPTWDFSLRAVRPGGTIVVVGVTGGANPAAQLNRVFWRHITIAGSSMGTRSELVRLVALCANGTLSPLVDSVTDFDGVADAMQKMADGKHFGKLVIRVSG